MAQDKVTFPPQLIVPTQLFSQVADYLASRPWGEANGLMQGIQQVFASHVIIPTAPADAVAESETAAV